MPTLNWIGKDKVVSHHLDVPYRVLNHKYGFKDGKQSKDETGSGNMIIHGDNLEALKALLPKYEGKVKCIYIDPPYNTGNEGWIYNDNVNDPKMKKWLGEVVGKEGEDLSRHDKWLCMMYPRLRLLHKLLRDDGIILVSIDDNEQANLKLVLDEIFGSSNAVGPIIQNKMNAKNDTDSIQKNHEFILVYKKTASAQLLNSTKEEKEVYKEGNTFYLIKDSITTRGEGGELRNRPNLGYTIYYNAETNDLVAKADYNAEDAKVVNTEKDLYVLDTNLVKKGYVPIRPPKVRGNLGAWTWSIDKFNQEKKNIVITGSESKYAVKKRVFIDPKKINERDGKFYFILEKEGNSRSILDYSTNEGTKTLNDVMKESAVFDNPKNIQMLKYLIDLSISNKDDIILDSFAGSGTTAHAVLSLNKQDGGNRKFILVELGDYADNITAERNKRVIQGYGDTEGTGGAFDYYELGAPLFIEDEVLNEEVGEQKIRDYVWYTETQAELQQKSSKNKYYLGTHNAIQ